MEKELEGVSRRCISWDRGEAKEGFVVRADAFGGGEG